MEKLYGDLDRFHPFKEGTTASRTLRAFTMQLSRDKAVMQRAFSSLDQDRAIIMGRTRQNVAESIERGDMPSVKIREERQSRIEPS